MPTWTRIAPRYSIGLQKFGTILSGDCTEVWRGTGLPYEPTTGFSSLSVTDILEASELPRVVGQAHDELPNTVVLFKKVIDGPYCGKVKVLVQWGPRPLLGLSGPRLYGHLSGSRSEIRLEQPNFTRDGGNNLVWAPRPVARNVLVRRNPFLVTIGANPRAIADPYEVNIGARYEVEYPGGPTIPVLLNNYQFVDPGTGVEGQAVLIVESISYCPLPGVQPNGSGVAVAIPALTWLTEYAPPIVSGPLASIGSYMPDYPIGTELPFGP